MNIGIKERFMGAWEKHFPGSELPISCFYSDKLNNVEFPNAPKPNSKGYTCIFSQITPVRKGRACPFNMENMDESFLATDGWSKVKSRFSPVKLKKGATR